MKKIKLLMPIAALAAMAPVATMVACKGDKTDKKTFTCTKDTKYTIPGYWQPSEYSFKNNGEYTFKFEFPKKSSSVVGFAIGYNEAANYAKFELKSFKCTYVDEQVTKTEDMTNDWETVTPSEGQFKDIFGLYPKSGKSPFSCNYDATVELVIKMKQNVTEGLGVFATIS